MRNIFRVDGLFLGSFVLFTALAAFIIFLLTGVIPGLLEVNPMYFTVLSVPCTLFLRHGVFSRLAVAIQSVIFGAAFGLGALYHVNAGNALFLGLLWTIGMLAGLAIERTLKTKILEGP